VHQIPHELFELPGGFGARQRHLAKLPCPLLQKLHFAAELSSYSLPTLPVAYGAQKPVYLTGFLHKAAAEFQSSTLLLSRKYWQRR
jgi:hypothetical protein